MSLPITAQNELNQVAPPALPQAPNEYERSYQDQLNNVLRLYFNRVNALQRQLEYGGAVDYIDLDTSATVTAQMGRVWWDTADATLNAGMDYGVVQQVGQESYARVQNSTGVTIPNGTVVGFAGSTANALLVAPYLADGAQPTLYVLGVMTHDLPDSGQKGYCTSWGFARGLDTSAFAEGDILYASPTTAGALTNVKPTAPDNVIPIAAVVIADATDGVIFVRPTIMQMQYYGTFARTTAFAPAAANTAYALTFDTTRISNGIVIGGTASHIIVPESGLYDVSCSLQYSSGNSSAKDIYAWMRKNGVDVAASTRVVSLSGSGSYTTVMVRETVSLAASDYIEIMFASTDTNVSVSVAPATAFSPIAPAANLVVTQAQQ